jgi:oligosaccharide reducing-end xylanase
VPTEGVGYGMIIAVELDKQDEFDRLWTYAKTTLEVTSGADSGYFNSYCQIDGTLAWAPCLDPFGLQQFLMALLFANDRWGGAAGATGAVDYGADAKTLLTLLRHKQDQNGGVVDGVTDTFDAATGLAFDVPDVSAATFSRPSLEQPAYYALWAQATGDPFWTGAAGGGRAYWRRAANATTGLMPVRAYFDGAPVPGSDAFGPQTYRAQLSMALDQIWSSGDSWEIDENDRLLRFFAGQGLDQYGDGYTLDGKTALDGTHDPGLVIMNGASALIATANAQRTAFVTAVWNLATPTGPGRYYSGLLDLLSLLILGGQLQVY